MNYFICCHNIAVAHFPWGTVEAGDVSPGFLDDQYSGADIPRIQIPFPIAVINAFRHITQIKSGASRSSDAMNFCHKMFEKADIIPLDLRRLTNKNRAKLLSYVLSLTIEKRNKIKLIVGESE